MRENEALQKDVAAQRRHARARERIEKLRNVFRGNNNADAFAPIGDLIDESLGKSIDETEPQMLVLETQSLRDALEIQQDYGSSDDRDPLQGNALRIARDAVNALNLLIGSDPFLEAIDTRLLGPDAVQPLPEPARSRTWCAKPI